MDLKSCRTEMELLCYDLKFSVAKLNAIMECSEFCCDADLMIKLMCEYLGILEAFSDTVNDLFKDMFPVKEVNADTAELNCEGLCG